MVNLIIILLLTGLLYFTQCTNDSTDNFISLPEKSQDINHKNDNENELKRKFEEVINIMSEIEVTVNSLESKISQIKNAKPHKHRTKKYGKDQIKELKSKIDQLKNQLYLEKLKYDKLLKKLSAKWTTKKPVPMIDSGAAKEPKDKQEPKDEQKPKDYEIGDYYLQLGAFKNYKNALKLKQLMDELEVKTTIIKKKYYGGIHYENHSNNKYNKNNKVKENDDNYNISSNMIANWEQADIWSKETQENNRGSANMDYIEISPSTTIPYDKILYYVVSKNKYSFKTTLQLTKFLTQKGHNSLIRKFRKQ
jgi:hypothetical protein